MIYKEINYNYNKRLVSELNQLKVCCKRKI